MEDEIRRTCLVILSLAVVASLTAQDRFDLPDVRKPHQIVVEGNDLYVFDETDYSLHVYSISPLAHKAKIGRKGNGPHDFKYLPFAYVGSDELACTDFTKTVWFSKEGQVLKVKPYEDFDDFDLNSEMLLFPIRNRYLRITADHGREKRSVTLLDSGFQTLKQLYEGPFVWQTGAPVRYRTDTCTYDDSIVIADTQRGACFEVFDIEGEHIRTIDISRDVEGVPGQPLLHQFCVSQDTIYAVTNNKNNDTREMIVLDLTGRFIERLYLPLPSIRPGRGILRFDLFVVDRGRLYELIENADETGTWGLLVTDLGRKRTAKLN